MEQKGILPPQSIDLEEAIIGARLVDSKGVDEAIAVIKASDVFYKPEHRLIYEAIKQMYLENLPIYILSVSEKLSPMGRLQEAGGNFFLINITQNIGSD